MASENSFDIVSKIDLQEVDNAINQAVKEIQNRFDFRGSKAEITREEETMVVISDDEFKLKSVIDILQSKLIKRGISLKSLEYGKIEPAASNTVRQKITMKQGIDQPNSKTINTKIRELKLKVKSQVQSDQIRVSGKNKNDLQLVIQMLNEADLPIDLQFINFR